ncbi:16S rRNA (guanine(966)-N(2))-methyltransferase RsmD [Aurantivibrio infirmus]
MSPFSKRRSSQRGPSQGDGRNQLRIIGGKWRGRKLDFPKIEGLRPTGDRIRETLFNWLAAEIPGANCLDLFSGSGALGFEALSRGASKAVMIEHSAKAYQLLCAHRERLNAENAEIIHTTAEQWLLQANHEFQNGQDYFDLVFIDPPFQLNWLERNSALLADSKLFHPGSLIYLEQGSDQGLKLPPKWRPIKQKQAGQVAYGLYQQA